MKDKWRWWTVACCLLGVVSTFLPWNVVTLFGLKVNAAGLADWPGKVAALLFALLGFGVAVSPRAIPRPLWPAITILTGIGLLLVLAYHAWDRNAPVSYSVNGQADSVETLYVPLGWGTYVAFAAAFGLIGLAIQRLLPSSSAKASE